MKIKYAGFTLVESMVVVAISSILLTLAVPSLQSMVNRNRVDTVVQELATSLFYVRSEALKRRMNVNLCVSNLGGYNCKTQEPYDYSNGWLIYMDCNNSGTYDQSALTCDLNGDGVNETAELLRTHEKLDTQLTVTGNGNYKAQIGYLMNGRIRGIGGSLLIDLLLINDGHVSAKKVVVANSGRIRTTTVDP